MERELGRGGMAVVYLGRDLRHGRDVAVKVFKVEGGPADGAPRFLHEIQIAARLAHPNILPLHDSGESDGLLYYVMPFVPGESLRQRLEREGALPVADALSIACEVAGALSYAHSHGVIHRDIKPENILFIADHAVVADFGIARAISAGGWDESQLGKGPIGTPTYMSPEQARGGSRVDGRSDVYSLGCVLYEMLTGEPPFRGSTPEELVVQHMEAEPLPVQARRPTLPRELQAAVGKALAKHPADRYPTAQQFGEALAQLLADQRQEGAARAAEVPAGAPSLVKRWALPVLAAGAIVYALFQPSGIRGGWSRADPDLYLVAPFAHQDSAAPGLLNGDQCARLLHQALTRWEDVALVDSRWTADRLAQLGHAPSLEDLARLARSAHAGKLLSGEVLQVGDSVQVRGVLYDAGRSSRILREYRIVIVGSLADAERKFSDLADSLLLPRAGTELATGGVLGTRQIGAWRAYDSGHVSLAGWNLPEAARHFRRALDLDPQYGLAHLWLAQTMSWQGEEADSWRDQVLAALGTTPPLPPRERAWAVALAALGEARFQEACDRYGEMIKRDSLDFRGWYGRAECRARDPVVVADANSPSGWRFRSSYHAAIRDYQRALVLIPSSHLAFRGAAFSRLSEMFFAEPNLIRRGTKGSDSRAFDFAAYASLDHDTLAFIPQQFSALTELRPGNRISPSLGQAVAMSRRTLLAVTAEWARAFPGNAEALASQGLALEVAGELAEGDVRSDSAAQLFQRARALTTDPTLQVELASAELRILVKRGQFDRAEHLADSMLLARPSPTPEEAPYLAAAAVLRGKGAQAASLARLAAPTEYFWGPDGRVLSVPLPLRETALALEVYASLGGPADSVAELQRRARRQLETMVGQPNRRDVGMALFDRSSALLFPSDGWWPIIPPHKPVDYLLQLQRLVAEQQGSEARRLLAEIRQRRRDLGAGEIPLEVALQEYQVELAIGDSTAAIDGLDGVLSSVTTQGSDLLGRVAPTAALVRAMALRARLAGQRGDAPTARKYAGTVAGLWEHADRGLAPVVVEMRRITVAPSR
jgi:tetratricopeptide (TPR) repeat protein